ncbi:uncharacterized protein N7458_000461 [Penicillium daleae]|uniref:DRBM domain-containing protein n=1 Tax=Penicillium daleae TaxID=63821 RepID=A0AAD6CGV7_9EURO|nr:uncharacterized protein N7458_000461 [Penicillium daleae]KAJ5464775.1 hypothetical protein N7458_000461 [Penicillium daleae]
MSQLNSPQGTSTAARPSWQDQLQEPLAWTNVLEDHCRRTKLPPPVFNIVSDRRGRPEWSSRKPTTVHRLLLLSLTADADYPGVGNAGGRTAWSSTVTVQGHNTIAARYWYDGQYINNAKEDAAEVALKTLNQQPGGSTVYAGQLFP